MRPILWLAGGGQARAKDARGTPRSLGNSRIVSVKLGYYTEERIALKDVRDVSRRSLSAEPDEPRK